MNYRDLPAFTFTFEATLKTRELVRVILQITTAGRGAYFMASLFVPFSSLDGVLAQVKERLQAEAQAATNLWAISYASIEEAHTGYESLTRALTVIESPSFTVSHAIVQEILPLTPPKEVEAPEKSLAEVTKEKLTERYITAKTIRQFENDLPFEEISTDPSDHQFFRRVLNVVKRRALSTGKTGL
ncbi:MAG TPA: hypothetical protein VGI45_24790 [Terracidiphilus sp.]|jgi:hypothetical protein